MNLFVVVRFLCATLLTVSSINGDYGSSLDADLAGPYCQTRRPEACCRGRKDDCSVPILGTLCYCDEFCNRTRNDDCCPDFWSYCLKISPPENEAQPQQIQACYDGGRYYNYGETTSINCNQCECQEIDNRLEMLCESNTCLVDQKLIETINNDERNNGWHASNYSMFWGKKLDEGISQKLGTIHSRGRVNKMTPIKQAVDAQQLPKSFDARVKWPDHISSPSDQEWCGASWAFSTAAVASDRFSIMTGSRNVPLSPHQLINCNSRNQKGCKGGQLSRAWMFVRKFGLIPERCYPWKGQASECRVPKRKRLFTTPCLVRDDFGGSKKVQIYRVSPVYRIATEHGIMQDIMTSGPVQATMKVSRDFFSYKSGVYKCSSLSATERAAYHSVRIVGWGETMQNRLITKYWIVSNSWGEEWGENGYFRIRRGANDCEIEDFVIAAWPDLQDTDTYVGHEKPNYDYSNTTYQFTNDIMKKK